MEDDIDIEEHDLLDNPRIKSIFPDLSRVKIEVPDEDEMEVDQSEDIPDNYHQPLLYQSFNFVTENDENSTADDNFAADEHFVHDEHNYASDNVNFVSDSENIQLGSNFFSVVNDGHDANDDFGLENDNSGIKNDNVGHESDNLDPEHCLGDENGISLLDNAKSGSDYDNVNENINFVSDINNSDNMFVNYDNITNRIDDVVSSDDTFVINTCNDDSVNDNSSVNFVIENGDFNGNNADCTDDNFVIENESILSSDRHSAMDTHIEIVNSINNDTSILKTYLQNKIILGTKPSYKSLYNEAKNSISFVYLEDWGERLANSPCFCRDCEILFPTVNALDYHKMAQHSFLVALDIQHNTARKSTVSKAPKKLCNHCNQVFPDDTALIRHLYELLPVKKFEETQPSVTRIGYKCLQCGKICKSYYESKNHRNAEHREFNKMLLFRKVTYKADAEQVKTEPEKTEDNVQPKKLVKVVDKNPFAKLKGKFFEKSSLVPKSVLFQCTKCFIHFPSNFSALQHCKYCRNGAPHFKCTKCKRKIRSGFKEIHANQHKISDKIKIYPVSYSKYQRVLLKCPECSLCFDEIAFWTHRKNCRNIDSAHCDKCNIDVPSIRLAKHLQNHLVYKLNRKDFIIIDFVDMKKAKNNPEEIDPPAKITATTNAPGNSTPTKTAKCNTAIAKNISEAKKSQTNKFEADDSITDGKMVLFYCEFCRCCQTRLYYHYHMEKHCKRFKTSKRPCKYCGLLFTPKTIRKHILLHEKKSLQLKDFMIKNISTRQYINPPINNIFSCEVCNLNFIDKVTMLTHNCKTEEFKYCDVCNEKYDLKSYSIHEQYHFVKVEMNEELMPQLLEKYNSMNVTWNILYMCSECLLVSASYDFAVEHSQRHLQQLSDTGVNCKICKMDIEEDHFLSHQKLHDNNSTIDKKTFKILEYNYENLLTDDWLTMFQTISKPVMNSILSKSIYKDVRSIKMTCHSNSESELTKYICSICKLTVDVKLHINCDCEFSQKYRCKYCRKCTSLADLVPHESTHDNDTNEYKIVTFNDEEEKEYLNAKKPGNKSAKKFIFYKCLNCLTCLMKRHSIQQHKCIPAGNRRYCGICDQYVCCQHLVKHKLSHKSRPTLNKKNITVIHFKGLKLINDKIVTSKVKKMDSVSTTATIYKCTCDLHFTSVSSVQKHIDVCGQDIPKEKCSKCNLLFPTNILVSHLCKHHSKNVKIVVKNVIKRVLYKCTDCQLNYFNKRSLEDHDCHKDIAVHCSDCNNTFSKQHIHKHNCKETHNSIYIHKTTTAKNSNCLSILLYRCDICDLQFCTLKTYHTHVYRNHRFRSKFYKCKICKLRFSRVGLDRHKVVHNRSEYKIKIISPVNNETVIKTGFNSKDISDIASPAEHEDTPNATRTPKTKEVEICDSLKIQLLKYKSDNKLYKCPVCSQHFLVQKTLGTHISKQAHHSSLECDICGLNFSSRTLPRHKYIHHEKMNLTLNDLEILNCDFIASGSVVGNTVNDSNLEDDTTFDNTEYTDTEIDNTEIINAGSTNASENDSGNNSINFSSGNTENRLFKCGDCKICFTTQKACLKHLTNHKLIDSKDYIECKICEFQFLITSLKDHMELHHSKVFKIDDIMIEEYTIVSGEATKIDVYHAVDRVQSRLVSTTTNE